MENAQGLNRQGLQLLQADLLGDQILRAVNGEPAAAIDLDSRGSSELNVLNSGHLERQQQIETVHFDHHRLETACVDSSVRSRQTNSRPDCAK